MSSKAHFPIKLDRPLAIFDIESTGTSPRADRIIELAVIRIDPDGSETSRNWLVNPTIPIPVETTAVHGITDDIVKDCPTFAQIAHEVDAFIKGCDLGGYNVIRFDIPMLGEEFLRAGLDLKVDDRRVLDAQRIYHQREPRDLAAALSFFCGREHTDAHGAEADAQATLDVIKGQFRRYDDLPRDMETLDRQFNATDPFNADRSGRLRWVDGADDQLRQEEGRAGQGSVHGSRLSLDPARRLPDGHPPDRPERLDGIYPPPHRHASQWIAELHRRNA